MSEHYQQAGVNLEAGYESVRLIKKHIKRTQIQGAIHSLGAFGGMFDLSSLGMKEPILVSGTDGVGTKLLLAFALDKHNTIGQDAVAMCVNDILVQGAMPLYFLDYIAVGKNIPSQIEQIVKGIADGCVEAGCALIGGETAEMPGMYAENHYDIAGFTVGAVEKSKLITGEKVQVGDFLIGLPSSGVHSNGFSLVRKIIDETHCDLKEYHSIFEKTLGEELLTPTRIYVNIVKKSIQQITIHAMSHITGGGFYENIPRILPKGLGVSIDTKKITPLAIFDFLESKGNIPKKEIYNVFNMGIGFVFIVPQEQGDALIQLLKDNMEKPVLLGSVIAQEGVHLQW